MANDRRDFLKLSALLGLSGLAGSVIGKEKLDGLETVADKLAAEGAGVFSLPALPYPYEALEPFIDRQTMEIHHTKHHQAYVDKLNTANLNGKAGLADLCRDVDEKTTALVRNNLGGHYNHSFFWESLQPNPASVPNMPGGRLDEAIKSNFKSFEEFKKEFSDKAAKVFGSGWCWLVIDAQKKLKICTTPNQDNPLMKVAAEKGTPLIGLDVWEHAYYLKYQNKRADYINSWWNIVSWQKAEEIYAGSR